MRSWCMPRQDQQDSKGVCVTYGTEQHGTGDVYIQLTCKLDYRVSDCREPVCVGIHLV